MIIVNVLNVAQPLSYTKQLSLFVPLTYDKFDWVLSMLRNRNTDSLLFKRENLEENCRNTKLRFAASLSRHKIIGDGRINYLIAIPIRHESTFIAYTFAKVECGVTRSLTTSIKGT